MSIRGDIICIGGDGIYQEEKVLLDLYLLSQSKPNPKICLLPTASADNRDYINFFMRHCNDNYICNPSFLSLFSPHTSDIESFLMEQDIIYVGGGNTKTMLGIWKEWELPKILKTACENGTILSGSSAGAVCWFDQCITDSIPGSFRPMDCLGFIYGSFSPHYNSQQDRRPAFHKELYSGNIKNGYACDEAVGIHFKNGEIYKVISSSLTNGLAYKLELMNKNAIETSINPENIVNSNDIEKYLKLIYET